MRATVTPIRKTLTSPRFTDSHPSPKRPSRMSDVPPEIIRAIFYRLPVKSLLRFRAVSKKWRSLIDGASFIKLHLQHSRETNSNRTLVVDSVKLFYIDMDSFKRLSFGQFRFDPQSVVDSCNGLVLLVSMFDNIALWNPSTRKVNRLPTVPIEYVDPEGVDFVKELYGFGYDSKNDDYKIVRVVQAIAEADGAFLSSESKIYSLASNSWRRIADFPYKLPHGRSWGVYLNDALHTVVKRGNRAEDIMAFDLVNEKHYEVPKPEFPSPNRRLVSVEVMQGRLTAVVAGKRNTNEIWVMKEYGVKGSWFKLLCFLPPIPKIRQNLYPLAYSKSGDEVLLNLDGMCLNWYNLKKKTVTIACVDGLSASFDADATDPLIHATVCIASLVSPHCPRRTVSKTQSAQKGKEGRKKRDDFLSAGFKLKL